MHRPVLLEETVTGLITKKDGIYVDCTVGGGGHLDYLLKNLEPEAMVVGLDKDADVLANTRQKINYQNLCLIQSDFRYLEQVLTSLNISQVDGIMLDLGVSSFQLDQGQRGFSFHQDAPLDMRMNREQDFSAWDLVNSLSEEKIRAILYKFGEEKFAPSIATAIVEYRSQKSIENTLELVEIIKAAVPARYARQKHPARKSFQAFRIAVNSELEALQELLPQAIKVLKSGGRLCVISFHSLEDRIVKHFYQEKARICICPPHSPVCTCNWEAELRIITRKPIVARPQECEENPRARSAKLRIAEKI